MRGKFAVALVLGLSVAASTAGAQETSAEPASAEPASAEPANGEPTEADRARALYAEGVTLAAEERWAEALRKFEQALALVEHPNILRAVAGALERLGRFREAVARYERWLELAPEQDPARDEVVRLRDLDGSRLGQLTLRSSPPGATTLVDGETTDGGAEQVLALDPGAHTLTVSAERHQTRSERVVISEGQSLELEITLTEDTVPDREPATETRAAPEAPLPTPEPPARSVDPVGPVLIGAGLGVTVVGAILIAVGAADWVVVENAVDREWTELADAHGRAGPLLVSGGIVAGIGLAVLAVGTALTVSQPSDDVAIRVTGRGLALAGVFP